MESTLSELLKEKWALTEEEFNKMYNQVEEITFREIIPNKDKPTAIVIGGQPGAGKSSLVLKSNLEFYLNGNDMVILDMDIYRSLYKNSFYIARNFPDYYEKITGTVTGKIMEKLSKKVIEEGYNFIFEGTMGKSIYTIELLQKSSKKFNVIARIMAVSREESLLSIYERYLEMRKKSGVGRLVNINEHDERYTNLLNIAGSLEEKGIEVEVYERSEDITNPLLIYKTSWSNNTYDSVELAIHKGREKSKIICIENAEARLEAINNEISSYIDNSIFLPDLQRLNEIFTKKRNQKV